MDLQGKVVVITGASSGIGLEMAKEFAREGCHVAMGARGEDRLEEARTQVEEASSGKAEALSVVADVQDERQVRALVDAAHSRWGRVDVLVNNAGWGAFKPFVDTSTAEVRDQMETNYFGAVYGTKAALEYMMPQRSGHIINIASIAAKVSTPNLAAYSATKAALDSLSMGLRAELARYNIHVTAVHPIPTRTNFTRNPGFTEREQKGTNLFGQKPEAVAKAVVRAVKKPRAEVYPQPGTRVIPLVRTVLAPLVRLGLRGIARIYQ